MKLWAWGWGMAVSMKAGGFLCSMTGTQCRFLLCELLLLIEVVGVSHGKGMRNAVLWVRM